MKKFLVLLIAMIIFPGSFCFSGLSDEWVRKGTDAAVQLAQGNAQGAAHQAVPSYYAPLGHQTNLNAGLGGVSLRQGLIPSSALNTKYLNFGANYNVGSALNFNGSPNLSQNVQVTAGNPYLSNTTTFTPKLGRK